MTKTEVIVHMMTRTPIIVHMMTRTMIIVHMMTRTKIIVQLMTKTNLGDEKIELLLSWSLGLRESGIGFGRSDIKLKTVALIMMLRRVVIDNRDLEMG